MSELGDQTQGNENQSGDTTPLATPTSPSPAKQAQAVTSNEPPYVSLESFAQAHARTRYGIELMAGFYHEQETAKHFADTEENWHALIKAYANKEVK